MPPRLDAAAILGLCLRPVEAADAPFVASLYASTRADEVARFGWPAGNQRAFLSQQCEAQELYFRSRYPDAEWLIVERDGAAVGRLYLEQSAQALHVIDISLVPAARGQGLGAALLADIVAAAAAAGRKATMHVERSNPARRLYARLGFVVVGETDAYLLLERSPRI